MVKERMERDWMGKDWAGFEKSGNCAIMDEAGMEMKSRVRGKVGDGEDGRQWAWEDE